MSAWTHRFLAAALPLTLAASADAAPPADAATSPGATPEPARNLELSWSAPEGCPLRAEVEGAIERYLGGPSEVGIGGSVRADATVSAREGGGFRLALIVETTGGTSVAKIDAERCDLLAKAAALKVAVAVDPMAVLGVVEAAPSEPPATSNDPEPAPEESPEESEVAPVVEPPAPIEIPEPRPPEILAAVRAEGRIGYGVLPGFGAGVGLSAAVVFPRWRFEAGGGFWPARPARLVGRPDAGGDLLLGTASLRGCPTPKLEAVEFPLCLGVELGAMRGDGVGVDRPVTETRLWAAALVSVGLAWRSTDHLALWVEGQGALALVRPEFLIENAGRVHQANPAAPRGLVGLEVRFP